MKKQQAIYERELLVSSDDEISVFTVRLYGERVENKLVVLITSKFDQNPKRFIDSLVINIENEIFKRLNVDMIKNVQILLLYNQCISKAIFESDSSAKISHIEDLDISYINGLEC
ncbi:MAG: hypothetical protein ACM3UU_05950 [Ignavibacteriales bacterium]